MQLDARLCRNSASVVLPCSWIAHSPTRAPSTRPPTQPTPNHLEPSRSNNNIRKSKAGWENTIRGDMREAGIFEDAPKGEGRSEFYPNKNMPTSSLRPPHPCLFVCLRSIIMLSEPLQVLHHSELWLCLVALDQDHHAKLNAGNVPSECLRPARLSFKCPLGKDACKETAGCMR